MSVTKGDFEAVAWDGSSRQGAIISLGLRVRPRVFRDFSGRGDSRSQNGFILPPPRRSEVIWACTPLLQQFIEGLSPPTVYPDFSSITAPMVYGPHRTHQPTKQSSMTTVTRLSLANLATSDNVTYRNGKQFFLKFLHYTYINRAGDPTRGLISRSSICANIDPFSKEFRGFHRFRVVAGIPKNYPLGGRLRILSKVNAKPVSQRLSCANGHLAALSFLIPC